MNKVILPFLMLCTSFIVFSCTNNDIENQELKFESPIRVQNLTYGSNILHMEDFVNDVTLIDSVVIDGLKASFYQSKKQIAFQSADFKNPLLLMRIWINNKSLDVLLKKSRKQKVLFSYNPQRQNYDSVQIAGEMNGWTPSRTQLEWHNNAWQQMLFLEPGKYAYQIVADNKWMLDKYNKNVVPNGQGGENSVLIVGDTGLTKAPHLSGQSYDSKEITFDFSNHPKRIFVFWNNQNIPYRNNTKSKRVFSCKIPAQAKEYSLSYIRVFAYNEFGVSNDLLIPLVNGHIAISANELPRNAWHSNILYNVFVDRFYDGDSTNNKPLPDSIVLPQANYNGGDMQGIIQKTKEGYFKDLGVNSLWISPVVKNTEGAFGYWPKPETKFSAYHGYWPTSFTQINPHFGDANKLKELVKLVHENNTNIYLDMVANHVHQEHPYYKAHPDCATELHLPDGSLNLERWDDHRLTTWFDKFLPTLNLERPEIAKMLADSTVWWAKEYGIDGFRYDAAKHIPLSYWRILTKELKDSVISKGQPIYQLGETYGNSELIGSYISNGLLDAQFDFNVYDAAVSVFAGGNKTSILSERLNESIAAYGSHNLMANITGNQDRARFISYAGGALHFDEDAKVAGWTRDIEIGDSVAFKKLQMLMAFNMTIPGIPVIYYGDEFGMPGGNDPDCRRMMRFGNQLSAIEKQNLAVTKKLIKLRKSNMAFLYGDINEEKQPNENCLSYSRQYFNQYAWVGFNNSDTSIVFKVILNADVNSKELKANFGNKIKHTENGFTVKIPANSFEIITIN